MHVPSWVKPGVWGGMIGAVAMMIVGFAWWGWTLGSTAESLAKERADAAVVALLTPLCVERFLKQPDALTKLAEFQRTAAWQQSQVVEKGGWATTPGSTTPNAAVARACAAQLTKTKT
jgi:hypothetical protein